MACGCMRKTGALLSHSAWLCSHYISKDILVKLRHEIAGVQMVVLCVRHYAVLRASNPFNPYELGVALSLLY